MKYTLASDTWDNEELSAIDAVIKTGQYTMGKSVSDFEDEFSEFLGVKHSIMVNSGSSANLIMLHALSETNDSDRNEILVPAVSWSTTFFPVHQAGFKLKFVDINIDTLNMDLEALSQAINKNTLAVLWVNLLGNCADLAAAKHICEENGILLLEDNCESFGASTGDKKAGSVGFMGTHSFFFSHHLQTMEGGMLSTNCDEIAAVARSLRAHGWTRDTKSGSLSTLHQDDFQKSFEFILPGFCVRPIEFMGAIGSVQLKKWPKMYESRQQNASFFKQKAIKFQNEIKIQDIGNTLSSWFGFSIILNQAFERTKLIECLKLNDIECRPIVAGNFTKQKVMSRLKHVNGNDEFRNADILHEQGLFIGNDSKDLKLEINHFFNVFEGFINEYA